MKKEDMYGFLLRTAIPEVTEKKNRPKCLEKSSNLIWDAIYRAHRDVITGRQYVKEYSNCKVDDEKSNVNKIAEALYQKIVELGKQKSSLKSEDLIKELYKKFKDEGVKYGHIQKLVNMTLKYLFILQTYEYIPELLDEKDCDCPLDSIILQSLSGYKDIRWTQLDNKDKYDEIQKKIKEKSGSGTRLAYDFENWQKLKKLTK